MCKIIKTHFNLILGRKFRLAGRLWTLHEVGPRQVSLPGVAGFCATRPSSNAFICGCFLGSCPQTVLFPHARAADDHRLGPRYLFGAHSHRCVGCRSAKLIIYINVASWFLFFPFSSILQQCFSLSKC